MKTSRVIDVMVNDDHIIRMSDMVREVRKRVLGREFLRPVTETYESFKLVRQMEMDISCYYVIFSFDS